MQRSCIDPYSDRDFHLAGSIDNLFNCAPAAYISGIDSQPISAGAKDVKGKPMVKVNIGNERGLDLFFYLPEGGYCLLIGNGQADNLASRVRELFNLMNS